MTYKLRLTCICLLILGYQSSFAQYNIPGNKVWIFDALNGIDFNTVPPHSISSNMCYTCQGLLAPGSYFEVYPPGASVCDMSGNLLFYTDGSRVWNKNNQKMANASPSLGAGSFVAQVTGGSDGALITGMPDSVNKYYVFSLTELGNSYPAPGTLFYSVVDMQMNSGLGDVVPAQRWIQLDTGLSQKMTAVPGNSCNIWLIAHAKNTNMFKAYEITWKGVNPHPVISYTGNAQGSPIDAWDFGELTISPNRHKLASAYGEFAELYDFDPATGIVSNGWTIDSIGQSRDLYGICFSPDNSKLYITRFLFYNSSSYADCAIDQLDLSQPTNSAILFSLNNVAGAEHAPNYNEATIGDLRLAIDGKIYFSGSEGTPGYFKTIEYPNVYGSACVANQNAIAAATTYGGFGRGMGNEPVMAIPNQHPDTTILAMSYTCVSMAGSFRAVLHAPQNSAFIAYFWSNGADSSTCTITQPGTYQVYCVDRCSDVTVQSFTVRARYPLELGNDTTYCPGDTATLAANYHYASYLWNTGSTDSSIEVTKSGIYTLTVSDTCGMQADTIQLAFNPTPPPTTIDTNVCQNVMAPIINVAGDSVLWYTAANAVGTSIQPVIPTDTPGIVTFYVSQNGVCGESALNPAHITIDSLSKFFLPADTAFCTGNSLQVSAQPQNIQKYLWNTGDTTCCISVTASGEYIITGIGKCGTATDTVNIKAENCNTCIWAPSAFTPNGDGKNDVFRVTSICAVSTYHIIIEDRWGDVVFESYNISQSWDGTFHGVPADIGTYFFVIEALPNLDGGNQIKMKGDLTLIR